MARICCYTQPLAAVAERSRPSARCRASATASPFSPRGRHRRVLLRDILDYTERTRAERRSTLDQMATDAEDDGLYEATIDPRSTRVKGIQPQRVS